MPEFLPTLIAGLVIFLIAGLAVAFPQQPAGATGGVITHTGNHLDYFIVADSVVLRTNEVLKLNDTASVNRTHNHFANFYFKPAYNSTLLKIKVHETNSQGMLMVLVNSKVVYAGYAKDIVEVEFDDDMLGKKNDLEVKVGSPGWRFWESPEYSVGIEVYGLVKKGAEKDFTLSNPRDAKLKIFLLEEPEGELTIKLNGKQLFKGSTGEYMELEIGAGEFKEHNRMELVPSHDGYFNIDYAEIIFK
ncbi:MAG: hypothetical protein ACE5J7_01120 [Candidatus Aenigmatarchaeota archaeon]